MSDHSINTNSLSVKKEVWEIGGPAIVESLFTTFASIIDTKMVSALGVAAISAVSVTNQPRLFIFCIFFAINVAISALVARCMGQKDRRKANEFLVSAFILAVIACIVISIICVVAAKPIMILCSGQKDTMALSIAYFRIVMGGMIFNTLFMLINSALRGCGYTKLTMQTNIVSSLVNICCNYLLIEGHFGFPRLGINGAAIATVTGTAVALVVSIVKLFDEKYFVNARYIIKEHIRISKETCIEFFDMWKNICIENLMTRVGFLISSMITARIGSFDMSIYSIGMTLMNITFAFGDGLQSAAVALIGRSIGEKRVDKVKDFMVAVQKCGLECSIVIGLLYAVFGRLYYSFFSSDTLFINKGMVVSFIIAIIGPIQVAQIIFNGALKSMGCTKETLFAAVISVTIVNPVVAFVLTYMMGMGIWGVWISIFVSQLTRLGILLKLYWRQVAGGELWGR
ncbi:MAG: MATE family efflux transporter [Bariatricus sp.]